MSTDKDTVELLRQVKAGSDEAFEKLVRRYRTVIESSVYSFAKSAGNIVSEEDLRQEAELALYRAAQSYDIDRFEKSVTFGLYGKVCIRNALITDQRRRVRAEKKAEKLRAEFGELSEDNVSAFAVSRIELEELKQLSDDVLSPYENRIFRELAVGKAVREISQSVGRDEKSVSNAIYRIKVKLRKTKKDQV